MIKNQMWTCSHGTHSPQSFDGKLKRYGTQPYYIGTTTSVGIQDVNKFFKGDIDKGDDVG